MRLRQLNEPMLTKLFSKKGDNKALIPPGRRIYAVGDVHGCLAELRALMGIIDADSVAAPIEGRRLIFLGDYVDRGPDSKGVIETMIGLRQAAPEAVFLKGNHEAAMLDFMANPRQHGEWLHWGGDKTLESYGLAHVMARDEADLAAELSRVMPTAHRDFLESLDLMHVEGDYVFVHAGLKPGVALDDQDASDLMWIRNEFHKTPSDKRPDKIVVHGHHPVKKPQDEGWRINVDTGACWSGMLSALVLEETSRRFLTT